MTTFDTNMQHLDWDIMISTSKCQIAYSIWYNNVTNTIATFPWHWNNHNDTQMDTRCV